MRKGRVVVSFSDVVYGTFSEEDVIDVPDGVDWVRAGFVVLIAQQGTATVAAPERAVLPVPSMSALASRPVTAVNGIGPGAAKKLAQLNIRTVKELADADPVVISGLPKIGLATAVDWVNEAINIGGPDG